MPYIHRVISPEKTTITDYTTKWMGENIARSHAFLPAIKIIARHQLLNDVTTIALIGRESTGKTTLARSISHYLHIELTAQRDTFETSDRVKNQLAKGYCVRLLTADDLIDFKNTLQKLPNQNRILIFDDVSFMIANHTAKNLQKLQNEFTTIRHVEGSEDLRTVIILNFHYNKALGPYLRDTNFRFHTSLMNNDFTALKDVLGGNHMLKTLRKFQTLHTKISTRGSVSIPLGKKSQKNRRWVKYTYDKPFRLTCFVDGNSARIKIYPQIDDLIAECKICSHNSVVSDNVNYQDITEFLLSKYSDIELRGAANAMVVRRYGMSFKTKGTREAYTVIERLCSSGYTEDTKLISEILKNKSSRNIIPKNKKKASKIPGDIQKEFKEKFNSDCLYTNT